MSATLSTPSNLTWDDLAAFSYHQTTIYGYAMVGERCVPYNTGMCMQENRSPRCYGIHGSGCAIAACLAPMDRSPRESSRPWEQRVKPYKAFGARYPGRCL